jgi:hypothetical protein
MTEVAITAPHLLTPALELGPAKQVSGYYAQAMVSVLPSLDISAGAGITKVAQNDEDKRDWQDDDMDPATDSCCDKADPNKPSPSALDSVGFVTTKQQIGLAASATLHVSDSIHLQFEYLRIMFEWYKPTPASAATSNPEQNFHVVNAGITYAW